MTTTRRPLLTSARRLQGREEFPETLGVEATYLPAMEKSSIAEPHGAKGVRDIEVEVKRHTASPSNVQSGR